MTEKTCDRSRAIQPQTEVDLTDDQIQQLLVEAESRLRAPLEPSIDKQSNQSLLNIPNLSSGHQLLPYVRQQDGLATVDSARVIHPSQKDTPNAICSLGAKNLKDSISNKDKPTAGKDWFNLPQTELTTEFKRDLQLLRMRSVLDPKRHYKKENGKAQPPEFSHVGTVIEGPTEFFSSRIAKKDRKKTFVEETLVLEQETRRFESKYFDIQTAKQSGKKSFYNNLRAKRSRRGK
ncbi:hypothetical protein ASPWEDRAFT_36229 [Aspergillus wentii DTO 134E9]|uniref:Fcf2 pre-rRNA processing C-terminal domain-containing protein n=1 Tax=Aspergillus wentii DTO 134E9 TaxID=1073089 RepID=A0A1L9RUM1_ASPWE|nr:uncharacterized protein ASPWEDRAFT_36229 [Aspergillus wentii DTO 134E9]KAI9923539.1 hypothetical protein MW887_008546 [Aspergillus wentii]OJJ38557.1 hypothetical protein ASPWEDRAFT_36229 [Aspergillus wentii DTO 134E9]